MPFSCIVITGPVDRVFWPFQASQLHRLDVSDVITSFQLVIWTFGSVVMCCWRVSEVGPEGMKSQLLSNDIK